VRRTSTKICSICRPEDATLAAGAGANMIGLICHPSSKRYVDPDAARAIRLVLPNFVTPVGVFVDASPDHIRNVAGTVGFRWVQLHGHESEADVAALSDLVIIKAIKVDGASFRDQFAYWTDVANRHPQLRGVVLETGGTGAAGGTGVENDWALIAETLAAVVQRPALPVMAAGGLRPDNVAEVVRRLRPAAVDVSSGVEETLRVKSRDKVLAFVEAVRAADQA
jgi:phosphoribosylanthranilate isomerase